MFTYAENPARNGRHTKLVKWLRCSAGRKLLASGDFSESVLTDVSWAEEVFFLFPSLGKHSSGREPGQAC